MTGYAGIRVDLGSRTLDVMNMMYNDNTDAFKKLGLADLNNFAIGNVMTIFVDETADVKAIEAFISENKERYMKNVYGRAQV